jgi:hypothetical protein
MAFKMKGFEPHNMYKTEKANTKADHDRLEKQGYDHSPYNKMVPNCIPRGSGDDKLPKPSGDPCWDTHVQRGMKDK